MLYDVWDQLRSGQVRRKIAHRADADFYPILAIRRLRSALTDLDVPLTCINIIKPELHKQEEQAYHPSRKDGNFRFAMPHAHPSTFQNVRSL